MIKKKFIKIDKKDQIEDSKKTINIPLRSLDEVEKSNNQINELENSHNSKEKNETLNNHTNFSVKRNVLLKEELLNDPKEELLNHPKEDSLEVKSDDSFTEDYLSSTDSNFDSCNSSSFESISGNSSDNSIDFIHDYSTIFFHKSTRQVFQTKNRNEEGNNQQISGCSLNSYDDKSKNNSEKVKFVFVDHTQKSPIKGKFVSQNHQVNNKNAPQIKDFDLAAEEIISKDNTELCTIPYIHNSIKESKLSDDVCKDSTLWDKYHKKITHNGYESHDWYPSSDDMVSLVDEFVFRDEKIIDLGCGVSSFCGDLILHGYNNVTGVDISPYAIEFNRKQWNNLFGLVFKVMNGNQLEFENESIDLIFSKGLFDCIDTELSDNGILRIMDECFRVLKPGGILLLISCRNEESLLSSCWWMRSSFQTFNKNKFIFEKSKKIGIHQGNIQNHKQPYIALIFRKIETESQQRKRIYLLIQKSMLEKQKIQRFEHAVEQMKSYRKIRQDEIHETKTMEEEDIRSMIINTELRYQQRRQIRDLFRKEWNHMQNELNLMNNENILGIQLQQILMDSKSCTSYIVEYIIEKSFKTMDEKLVHLAKELALIDAQTCTDYAIKYVINRIHKKWKLEEEERRSRQEAEQIELDEEEAKKLIIIKTVMDELLQTAEASIMNTYKSSNNGLNNTDNNEHIGLECVKEIMQLIINQVMQSNYETKEYLSESN